MKRTRGWTIARRVVQIAVFMLFLTPLALMALKVIEVEGESVFYGTLSSSFIANTVHLMDPFSFLQVLAASKWLPAASYLIGPAIILALYVTVRARAFCGWVCPVNLVCEMADYVSEKTGIHGKRKNPAAVPAPLPKNTKVWVALAVLVLSALTCIPLFEILSPVGALSKAIVLGSTLGLWTLLAIVLIEVFVPGRIWCRTLCPLGGFYQALGRIGLLNVKMEYDKCIHCNACKDVCLANPEILDPVLRNTETLVASGDCMACGKCVDACPTKALALRLTKSNQKKTEENAEVKA